MRHYVFAVVLAVVPLATHAQSATSLPEMTPASRVRIWSVGSAEALKARVQNATQQTLEVTADAATTRVFHVSELERVDVSRGRNRWVWTVGGMLLGATAGVLISRADNDPGDIAGGLAETAEGMANTLSGALAGGAIGFFVAPERWRTVWAR